MSDDIPGKLRCLAGIHPHLNKDAQMLLNDAAAYIERLEKDVRTVIEIATRIKIGADKQRETGQ